MKILVYGAGVLGSYLAHTLIQAGNEVFMLARGERYKQLVQDGLVIQHYFQRKKTVDKINVVLSLEVSDYYDIIFVVMQYHQFQSVLSVLAANVSENIALVGNNADAESMRDFLIENSTTKKQVAFGFQISGGMRTDTGSVISIHGGGNVLAGELGDAMETFPIKSRKLRVAAYCRVSTSGPVQMGSLEIKIKTYTQIIESCSDWIFVAAPKTE